MDGKTQRVVIIIVAIFLVGAFAYFLWTKKSAEAKELEEKLNKDIKNDNTPQSYDDSEYLNIANALYNAMDGLGTDGQVVMDMMRRVMSNKDWLLLNKSFSVRDGYTLLAMVKSELGIDPIDLIIKKAINDHFAAHGVTARL